jgi:hypothetical protein
MYPAVETLLDIRCVALFNSLSAAGRESKTGIMLILSIAFIASHLIGHYRNAFFKTVRLIS